MCKSAFLATAFIGLSAIAGSGALAEDPMCMGGFGVLVGREANGLLSTRAGTACRMAIRVNGNQTLSSVVIVRAPRHGNASGSGATFRYQPRAGFTGQDSMTVRFVGVSGVSGKSIQGTVNFRIDVH